LNFTLTGEYFKGASGKILTGSQPPICFAKNGGEGGIPGFALEPKFAGGKFP